MPRAGEISSSTMLRVAEIVGKLVQGYNASEIVEQIKGEYQIKDRQAWKLVVKAKHEIANKADEGKEYHLTVAKERLNNWVQKSADGKDYRTAGILQRELNEITGLHQTGAGTTINVTNYYPNAETVQTLIVNPQEITGTSPNET